MKKIILALIILTVILVIAQPILNKDTPPISNIEELEDIDGIKNITTQRDDDNINLKILVENDISEEKARNSLEEVVKRIEPRDKKIIFSLLYEHGYLIGQGSIDVNEEEIKWN